MHCGELFKCHKQENNDDIQHNYARNKLERIGGSVYACLWDNWGKLSAPPRS